MHINGGGKKTFGELFKKLAIWQKAVSVVGAVAVVGGVGAGVYALADLGGTSQATSSDITTVSQITSSTTSTVSESESTQPESSAPSSKDSSDSKSSNTTSSKKTSSIASVKPASDTASEKTDSSKVASEPAVDTSALPEGVMDKYAKYYSANKDIIGWIKLANTKLNYPVVQGTNNTYYLDKNEFKKQSVWGVPYMDTSIKSTKDYQSTNTIIYGHSDDKNGLQLSATKGYREVDFYKQHPTIDFDTLYEQGTYKVVAYFITNQNAANWLPYHMFIEPDANMSVEKYIEEAKKRSYINTTVDVLATDKLLTTQTCQDTNGKNFNRLVMVARKVRPGEDASVDTSGATQNTAQVLPK